MVEKKTKKDKGQKNKNANNYYNLLLRLKGHCCTREDSNFSTVFPSITKKFKDAASLYAKNLSDKNIKDIAEMLDEHEISWTREEDGNEYHNSFHVKASIDDILSHLESNYKIDITTDFNLVSDEQLKDRCVYIFRECLKNGGKYDTLIREATTILEDRIRVVAEISDKNINGDQVINSSLNTENGFLLVSKDKKRRKYFHKMVENFYQYYRHRPHHILIGDQGKREALRIVYTIDQFLMIINKAEKNEQRTKQSKS